MSLTKTTCAGCAVSLPPDTPRTIDAYAFCQSCARKYVIQTTSGPCYTGATIRTTDTGRREWIIYAQDHFHCCDGEWYEHEENVPVRLLDSRADVLEECNWPRPKKGDLVFGVELEMEPREIEEGSQQEIIERLGGPRSERFICKQDGSLDYGVEMVTVPMSLEDHRTKFNWEATLRPVSRIAKSGSSTNHCGIHIHINRSALSELTIGKMIVFLNSDSTDHLVTTVAQRSNCGFACKKDWPSIHDARDQNYLDERYQRLNLRPRNTVEMRIFKGNLRPERILKNIEFAHATVCFCRDSSLSDVSNAKKFEEFIHKHRGTYPNLLRFLQEKRAPGYTTAFKPDRVAKKPAAPQLEDI